jgi:hypothetical protein
MTTLRAFVEAVWTSAKDLARPGEEPRTWAKRDLVSQSFELRRITTDYNRANRRTDFFEFYWADMMEDTKFSSVLWWLKRLLLRGPGRVPPAVREAWIAGILAILALVALGAALVLAALKAAQSLGHSYGISVAWSAVAAGIALLLWFLRRRVLVQVVGDAARYLTADPQNIAARSRIRTAGIKLLEALHDNPEYERIILVCHSLGTVIGYDLLNFYWGTVNEYFKRSKSERGGEVDDLERAIGDLIRNPHDRDTLVKFREAQRAYAKAVCSTTVEEAGAQKHKWKVTDFVTLGSPLTHAHFLMVDDRQQLLPSDRKILEDGSFWFTAWRGDERNLDHVTRTVSSVFAARVAQREFALCPPLNESGYSFSFKTRDDLLQPHHAAVFGPVRWTNIYAPCRMVFWGDVIGGPVRSIFGPGVKDVALAGAVGTRLLAHTHYWDLPGTDAQHLDELRGAIDMLES